MRASAARMCNLYTQTKSIDEIARIFRDLQIPLTLPEGAPNLAPRDIRITDSAPIVRPRGSGEFELIVRRWSWPSPSGKPVYNFRSEGRDFGGGRCLILADGFYEFTTPTDPKQKRKDRWLFTPTNAPLLCIAGLVRSVPDLGEAFTMLTTEPGADVAPFHSRQVAVVAPEHWRGWLDRKIDASEAIGPLPKGTLAVEPSLAATDK